MVVVLELRESSIVAGLDTDASPQFVYEEPTLFPENCAFLQSKELLSLGTRIHAAIRKCLDELLVTATNVKVVIVEPPLFVLPLKKLVTQVVLGELRCFSLAFTSYAACLCVCEAKQSAIIDTLWLGKRFVVPVYDLRELSHLIKSNDPDTVIDGDQSTGNAMDLVLAQLPRDLHGLLVVKSCASAWLGAAIACHNTELNAVSRSDYLNNGTLGDSIFYPS